MNWKDMIKQAVLVGLALNLFLVFVQAASAAGPAKLQKLQVLAQPVQGGHGLDLMIYLTASGDIKVELQSSHPNVIPVPSGLVHFPNVNRKKVHLSSNPVSSVTTVTLSAKYAGDTVTTQVTIKPPSETQVYTIPSSQIGDLLQLAESKGFRFSSSVSTGPSLARCKFYRAHSRGVLLSATVPSRTSLSFQQDLSCKYDLFQGSATLKSGWRLKSLRWAKTQAEIDWAYDLFPNYTADPTFRVWVTFPSVFVSKGDPPRYGLILESVFLEGPKGSSWQDAF